MFDIQVDLTHKHILAQTCFAADAKKGKTEWWCFVKHNQTNQSKLEYILQQWCFLIQDEKKKGLVPLRVKNLFQEQQEPHTTKNTVKQLSKLKLNGVIVNMQEKIVTVLIIMTTPGKVSLKFPQVFLR